MYSCIGIVLAGGLSSRMGQNKSTLMRNQHTMLDFSTQLLKQSGVDKVIISGGHQGLSDIFPQLGPVGGIHSVFSQITCHAALILPVDLPLMTEKQLIKLKTVGELSNTAVHFNQHSLPLYLPNNSFTELFFKHTFVKFSENSTNNKGPSIKRLLSEVPHKIIKCHNVDTLTNTNTPEQWQLAQQKLHHNTTDHNRRL